MSNIPVELKYAYHLSAIRLQNFMAFEDTGWIELRPITLLFGRNSSGKSAIIRALLLLKQSLESRDANAPLIFSGAFVDLGSYYNAVHRHNLKRDISFGFRLSRPPFEEPPPADSASEKEKVAYAERVQAYEDSKAQWLRPPPGLPIVDVDDSPLELHLTFGLVGERSAPILKSLAIYGYRTPDDGQPRPVLVFQMARRGDGSWKPKSDVPLNYEATEGTGDRRISVKRKQFSDGLWKKLAPEMSSGCIPRRLWLPDAANFLQSDRPPDWQVVDGALEFFWEHLTALLRGMVYLPPLRDEPRRYYRADHGWVRELTKEKLQEVNQWLRSAAINAEVVVETLADKEGVAAVYLRESKAGDLALDTNLRDVGSGVSQVLPVIVGSLQAPRGGAIVVEQPELHLHPSAQAELADIFVSLAQSGSICILETHSVSVINRIRRRVAEKRLLDSQFSAVFVQRADKSSACKIITIKQDGEYACELELIEEFFGTDTDEITLLKTAGISLDLEKQIKSLRAQLKQYESLFDGEKVHTMFAILSIHPRSAVQMMRVWAEYVCKQIAKENNINFSDNDSLSALINKISVFDKNTKNLIDIVRQMGNTASHASQNGIYQPDVKIAYKMLSWLVDFLDQLEKLKLVQPKRLS